MQVKDRILGTSSMIGYQLLGNKVGGIHLEEEEESLKSGQCNFSSHSLGWRAQA